MLVVNKLTKPGDIKRIELGADSIRVILIDRTERIYSINEVYQEQEKEDKVDDDNVHR